MKHIKKLFQSFTITILPANLEKNVSRYKLPNYIIPLVLLIFIIPIVTLVYYVDKTHKLKTLENEQIEINNQLKLKLSTQTERSDKLLTQVTRLEERATKVRNQLNTLNQLETELREHIESLPVDLPGIGGIEIPIEDDLDDFQTDILLNDENGAEEYVMNLTSRNGKQSKLLINRLEDTLSMLEKTNDEMNFVPTKWPVNTYFITSDFGKRTDPFNRRTSVHTGIDIRGNYGDPVYASGDGKVISASYNGGYGNAVQIQHNQSFQTLYGHLLNYTVKTGEYVKKGDLIGRVGSTGRSTGPHLHFEIKKNGELIHPKEFIDSLK